MCRASGQHNPGLNLELYFTKLFLLQKQNSCHKHLGERRAYLCSVSEGVVVMWGMHGSRSIRKVCYLKATIQKQGNVNAGTQLTFFFDSIWHASLWDGVAILRVGFLIHLNLSANKLIDASRGVFSISLERR